MRRLEALVRNLPADAALRREYEPEMFGWGWNEELLATVAEVVSVGNAMFADAHSKKGSPRAKPIEIPRPWKRIKKEAKRAATKADLRRIFGTVIPSKENGGGTNQVRGESAFEQATGLDKRDAADAGSDGGEDR